MSGYQRPRYGVGRGRMELPRVQFAPVSAAINSAFQIIEIADAQNLKTGQEAQVPSVLLTDRNNVTWRLTVNTDGTLSVLQVQPR
jgi:hypothetical protein